MFSDGCLGVFRRYWWDSGSYSECSRWPVVGGTGVQVMVLGCRSLCWGADPCTLGSGLDAAVAEPILIKDPRRNSEPYLLKWLIHPSVLLIIDGARLFPSISICVIDGPPCNERRQKRKEIVLLSFEESFSHFWRHLEYDLSQTAQNGIKCIECYHEK